ncbi:TEX26 protein, partial [Polypterus senegalus]
MFMSIYLNIKARSACSNMFEVLAFATPLPIQLNEDILKPEFREQLQFLKLRSTSEVEREKCDKLAASLILTGHLNKKERLKSGDAAKRPKTAMAALGVKKHWDPYETTNNREFNYTPDTFTEAIRPKTSRAYAYPYERSDPIGNNSYSEEFCWKPFSKPEPIRSGSSSGNRRNNPQSSQSFIVWRIPHSEQKISVNSKSPWRKTYSEEELKRALKAQYRTTYEEDYMGIPQGFQIKHAIPVPPNWKKSILQCPETEFRRHFQQPQQNSELMVKTTRYGSNVQHQVATRGAVKENSQETITSAVPDKRSIVFNTSTALHDSTAQHIPAALPDNEVLKTPADVVLSAS